MNELSIVYPFSSSGISKVELHDFSAYPAYSSRPNSPGMCYSSPGCAIPSSDIDIASVNSDSGDSTCTEITIPDHALATSVDEVPSKIAIATDKPIQTCDAVVPFSTKHGASLTTLPAEVQLLIFDNLYAISDSCTSTCLGLTCRTFYSVHRAYFPVAIDLLISTPRNGILSRQWNLCDLLKSWVPDDMDIRFIFDEGKVLFMTEEQWSTRKRHDSCSRFGFLDAY